MNEDLFGSIKQTITETAGAVGKKTEEFVETQKMRNKVRTLQREIRKKYADVGEIVYKRYVDGDTMDEELTGHCEVVMGLQKELAECKESMAAKQGKNVCPACGISNPKDAVFCMYCGTELPGEEEEKEEEGIDIEAKEEITFDDFMKMQFQVGEIIACEEVKKSKKLLCSQVKIGSQVKQIVSGIKGHYTAEEMVGKKVMVLVNLKPAKLAGVLSEGMLLCAEDAEGNLALMTPEKTMPAGAEIC